jgi:hypothetical protein
MSYNRASYNHVNNNLHCGKPRPVLNDLDIQRLNIIMTQVRLAQTASDPVKCDTALRTAYISIRNILASR